MAYFYYTLIAILLYFLSDWILNRIEYAMGKRLKYRSVVFFFIIMTLSVTAFEYIGRIVGEPPQTTPQTMSGSATETAPAAETAPPPVPAGN